MIDRAFIHTAVTVACWLATVMFGMLVWITEVVAQ